MIKVNMEQVDIEGDPNHVTSELALMIHAVCDNLETKFGIPYAGTLERGLQGARIYPLTDAGMTIQEALDVVGMKNSKINMDKSVMPEEMREGTRTEQAK